MKIEKTGKETKMTNTSTPTVGRIVHYVAVAIGEDGELKIRPAIVTAENGYFPSLAILHEHALEFRQAIPVDDRLEPEGGTWHWPPRQ